MPSVPMDTLFVEPGKQLDQRSRSFDDTLADKPLKLYSPVIEELDLPALAGHRHRHHESLVAHDPELICDVPTVEFSAELGGLGQRRHSERPGGWLIELNLRNSSISSMLTRHSEILWPSSSTTERGCTDSHGSVGSSSCGIWSRKSK